MSPFTDRITPGEYPKMPQEYRELFARLLTIQADCEIGGPHIYVDHWTLRAPTVDDQWRVARIAAEEIDHCRKMLRLLQLVGIDRSDILWRPRSQREGVFHGGSFESGGAYQGSGSLHPAGP